MALTKKDLIDIQQLIDTSINKNNDALISRLIPIFNEFATKTDLAELRKELVTKSEFNELKDDVARLDRKIDTTIILIRHQTDENTNDIKIIKNHLSI